MHPSRGSRIGIHRQDRVHEEALCFAPTSDGTQTLGGLMTRLTSVVSAASRTRECRIAS